MYEFDPLRPCATALGLKGGRQNLYAVCPGGEGAVLKTVGPEGLAGSVSAPLRSAQNWRPPDAMRPVCGAYTSVAQLEEYRSDTPVVEGSNPSIRTIGV